LVGKLRWLNFVMGNCLIILNPFIYQMDALIIRAKIRIYNSHSEWNESMDPKTLKPRKKPVQSRSAEMVRTILEAAARVLEQNGLDGYTTNAVAGAAGVSVGSLYQYFPGKEALTVALIERETAILIKDVATIEMIADSRVALRRFIAACAMHQMRRPTLARLLDFEEQRLPLRQQDQVIAADLKQLILTLLSRLSFKEFANPDVVAADILAIVKGMVDSAGERGETNSASLEDRVCRAVFGYLGMFQGAVDQSPQSILKT